MSATIRIIIRWVLTASAISAGTALAQTPLVNPASAPAFVSSVPLFRANPPLIQPIAGKLPATMNIAVIENCDAPQARDLSGGSLRATGTGLSIVDLQNNAKCIVAGTLQIDANTPAGTYGLLIYDKRGILLGSADLPLLDNSAAGIPPGLAPEVDVLWNVMSQNNCSDVFGKRVSQSFYCVQIKIGNNSGHPLQLAGIGFAKSITALKALGVPQFTIANTSYASTRAVLIASQVFSARNILYNVASGAGLIMAGSTSFYLGTGQSQLRAKTRFLTLSTLVAGPLLQAFNVVAPDPILAQLKNLDDQSFRDNMVIPNNSQIQTVVFVAKQDVTMALREVQLELNDYVTSSRQNAHNLSNDRELSESAGRTAQAMEQASKSADKTISNSTRPTFFKGQQDPSLVKIALGNIIIVGDLIAYLQRVQVQGTGNSPNGVTIAISPTAPQLLADTSQTFTASVANDSMGSGVTWSISGVSCSGTTCGSLSNQTSTTVIYKAPSSAPAPNNTVTLTATSKADSMKSATTNIVITPAITVSSNPKSASATHGGAAVTFTATVSNDPSGAGVNWTIAGTGCAGPTCGLLTPTDSTTVSYAPPSTAPNPNTVTFTATGRVGVKSDSVVVTIN
jgi:hypothetical protein